MEGIDSLLLLKEKALAAFQNGDKDFFMTHLAENSINVTPSGILNKEGFIKKITSDISPVLSQLAEDTQVFILNNGNGVVTYKAGCKNPTDSEFSLNFLITTIYSNTSGSWQIIFHQQTPIT